MGALVFDISYKRGLGDNPSKVTTCELSHAIVKRMIQLSFAIYCFARCSTSLESCGFPPGIKPTIGLVSLEVKTFALPTWKVDKRQVVNIPSTYLQTNGI